MGRTELWLIDPGPAIDNPCPGYLCERIRQNELLVKVFPLASACVADAALLLVSFVLTSSALE